VKTSQDKEPSMNERISGRFIDHIMAGMEGILGEFGHLHLRDRYKHIDNKYIKPCLLRENHVKDPKIIETYHNITSNEIEEMMRKNPQSITDMKTNLKESKSISTIFNSSQSNLANVENLDMKEINFNTSKKDLAEAKIHHMLTEVMAKPQLRQRKYSRHQLDDEDAKINHKMHLQVRRMMSEKRQRKKIVRTPSCEPEIQINDESELEGRVPGTNKQLLDQKVHELLKEDVESPPPPYNAAEYGLTLSPKHLTVGGGAGGDSPRPKKKSEIRSLLDATGGTTATADNNKPQWMMFRAQNHVGSAAAAGGVDNPAFERQDSGEGESGAVLPWKREDTDAVSVHVMTGDQVAVAVPAYIRNKEHVSYSSPSNTLLARAGADQGQKKRNAIIGYFQKRDSLTFLGDLDNLDARSTARRNSKEGTDLLSVLANPVNIRKTSAPPLNRQISLSSMKPFDDDDRDSRTRSPSHLTPIIERKNKTSKNGKDTVLNFEDEIFRRK